MTTFASAHLVGAGGAVGALLRYYLILQIEREDFPVGTLAVNVLGSFAFGLLTFAGVGGDLMLLVGTGACGSFTTFSSFSFETVRLWETGERTTATANAAGNLLGALTAVGLARVLVWALGTIGPL